MPLVKYVFIGPGKLKLGVSVKKSSVLLEKHGHQGLCVLFGKLQIPFGKISPRKFQSLFNRHTVFRSDTFFLALQSLRPIVSNEGAYKRVQVSLENFLKLV